MTSPDRLAALLRTRLPDRKVIVVSHQEPVVHHRRASGTAVSYPASGVTTALTPIVEACRGTWVTHGSGTGDFDVTDPRGRLAWPPESPRYQLRRVRLSPEIERGHGDNLSRSGLWPLCHIAYTAPLFRQRDWEAYREANVLFAHAVLDEIGAQPAVVLVNDHPFTLLPRLLREARPDLLIAHFWHLPWPNREAMRVMPWGEELLDGMLGSDLLGFQVKHHCLNFLDTADRGVEARVDPEHERVVRGGRSTYVRPLPVGIDAEAFRRSAVGGSFERLFPELARSTQGQLLLVGVDRLDYTKGIPHRLRMVEALIERRPGLRGKLTLVQIGAPTHWHLGRYRALADEVEELAAEINERLGQPGWRPIQYVPEQHDRERLAALLRRADACLVTSLHDGMNLVAKEYVVAQSGRDGVLVLSRFTGAARELPEACLINPYDIEGSADLIDQALQAPASERQRAMQRLSSRVMSHDVYEWGCQLFATLADVAARGEATAFAGN